MSASAQTTHHNSSGNEITEEEDHATYSSTVHKSIIFINGGAVGLLQVVTNQSSTNEAYRKATILCFWVFILIYIVLGVSEVKLQNQPNVRNFVGHVSHLFGALAAFMLISLISPSFILIVVPLWLVWFFVVMYVYFPKLVFPEDTPADSPV